MPQPRALVDPARAPGRPRLKKVRLQLQFYLCNVIQIYTVNRILDSHTQPRDLSRPLGVPSYGAHVCGNGGYVFSRRFAVIRAALAFAKGAQRAHTYTHSLSLSLSPSLFLSLSIYLSIYLSTFLSLSISFYSPPPLHHTTTTTSAILLAIGFLSSQLPARAGQRSTCQRQQLHTMHRASLSRITLPSFHQDPRRARLCTRHRCRFPRVPTRT
jgi:hypothetical protein